MSFTPHPMSPNTLPLPTVRSPSPATLHGWRLTLARIVWAVCASFAIALFLAFIPLNWYGVRDEWLVQSSAVAVSRYVHFGAFANYVLALNYFVSAVSFGVAALIIWRKSDDGVALLMALGLILLPTALVSGEGGTSYIYKIYGSFWYTILPALRGWLALVSFHYTVLLFFIFPDGRFVPRWTKGWAVLGGLASLGLIFGLFREWIAWDVWAVTFLAWLILAVWSQIYRYLRVSGPAERQQTKWFVAAIALMPLWLLVSLFGLLPNVPEAEGSFISLHLQLALLLFIPLGVGIGVLRRGLWGADPIINRTLVYGALTVCVILLYVLIVGGLSALLQSSDSVLLSALVTGAIAFLFQPLRQHLQSAVNRLMYGDRDDPATVLARLGQRLESTLAPNSVLPTIVETVARALKAPYAAIEVDIPTGTGLKAIRDDHAERSVIRADWKADGSSSPTDHLTTIPLTYQSETIGRLLVAPRAPGEVFTPADLRLLNDLARQAAPAVHAQRLTADLHRSRERIIVAREEERRRLRRDLHDELGPTLASQALKLDAALDWLDRDPASARKLLGEVKAQTQATVADVRRLVYELRPPALDELGLVGALRAHAQALPLAKGLRVTVDAPPDLPPLSAAVEVAAYRIALEALTNVVRHAQAGICQVRLTGVEEILRLDIDDDGRGLPREARAGLGLASMQERADELGGRCVIENRPGGGTRVYAELPITPSGYG